MDNEIGIIGYNKKEVLKYTNFDIFMNKLFLFLLPILIEGCIFYILQINITHFLIQFFGINFVLYSTIALIIFKKTKVDMNIYCIFILKINLFYTIITSLIIT